MSLRALSPLEAVRVVIEREIRERLRTKAVRWGTVLMAVLAIGIAVVPNLLPDEDDPEWTVAVVGDAPAGLDESVAALGQVESATITLEPSSDDPSALARRDGIDAVLVDGRELLSEEPAPDRLEILLTSAVAQAQLSERLAGLGVTPQDASDLLTPAPLEVRALEDDDDELARQNVAFLGILVLFFAIATYGGWVMNSVLEEKSNRIVEIIVAAVPPSSLLAGKVIAVGLVGLGQLVLVVAVGLGAAGAVGTLPDLPPFVPASIAWTLVWFVLGFGFYAVGYAAAGSLTARQEDAQSAATPLITVAMTAYLASAFLVNPDPASTLARIVSLIPPITPMAMPARMASGAAEPWEVALGAVLVLLATWLMVVLAARVYRNALLHSGGRIKARAALRLGADERRPEPLPDPEPEPSR